jgi:predicted membrane protein
MKYRSKGSWSSFLFIIPALLLIFEYFYFEKEVLTIFGLFVGIIFIVWYIIRILHTNNSNEKAIASAFKINKESIRTTLAGCWNSPKN